MPKKKKVKRHVKIHDGYHYLHLGYLDYIAARFLLNNNFMEQGITLSSTAVEKYIKAVLASYGVTKPVHLHELNKLEKLLKSKGITLLDDLDLAYLGLLGRSYRFRYFDDLKPGSSYGFLKWQVIGELDATISLIEASFTLKTRSGKERDSPYNLAKEAKNEHLYMNNFVLEGIKKKTFMEKEGPMFCLLLSKHQLIITMKHENIRVKDYKGEINVITMETG